MEDLVGLVGLRQLSLASNNLQHLGSLGGLEAPAFQELQTLDLTYNTLRPRDVLGVSSPLAMLPKWVRTADGQRGLGFCFNWGY